MPPASSLSKQTGQAAMKWVRYQRAGGNGAHLGIVEGNVIQEIDGDPFTEYVATDRRFRLDQVKLLTPVVPATFYAAGLNYRTHFGKYAEKDGKPLQLPTESHIGYRAVNSLVAHGDAIVIPKDSSGKVQFEGELVVVIGKQAKHVSEAEALTCVFGYTIGNDVSERSWQNSDRTLWRAKNTDTFSPMGPWIETNLDLKALTTVVRLNGREVSRFPTNDMIFGVAATISAITRYITLYPGDVIWMGTDEPTLDMVAGDTVEVEVSGIGFLRNPVVGE
jgi:2-keto-4-pentenoate hydratase/2-oxohepta-3-ene-1,7-dioic acid hydratase in catechol pathway